MEQKGNVSWRTEVLSVQLRFGMPVVHGRSDFVKYQDELIEPLEVDCHATRLAWSLQHHQVVPHLAAAVAAAVAAHCWCHRHHCHLHHHRHVQRASESHWTVAVKQSRELAARLREKDRMTVLAFPVGWPRFPRMSFPVVSRFDAARSFWLLRFARNWEYCV